MTSLGTLASTVGYFAFAMLVLCGLALVVVKLWRELE